MRRSLWQKTKALLLHELRANATPLRASLSLGMGVLIGLSPFYGLHFVMLVPLSYLFRLNRPLALLAVNITTPPVVPVWIAAGILSGRLFIPVAWCERIADLMSPTLAGNGSFTVAVAFLRRFFPEVLFERVSLHGHGLAVGFFQWALGSCILALVFAAVTVVVAYPLLSSFIRKGVDRI